MILVDTSAWIDCFNKVSGVTRTTDEPDAGCTLWISTKCSPVACRTVQSSTSKCYANAMTTDTPFASLENQLLVAMPQLQDAYFAHSVVYIWRHTPEGALGLVVNLPIDLRMDAVFQELGLSHLKDAPASQQIVLSGGPVETKRGFVLHDAPPIWPSSEPLADGLTITTSREILMDIAKGEGPEHYLLALGCAGWAPGQLEKEMAENAWFTCPATREIIFSPNHMQKPAMAAASLGFSLSQLTTDVGYS